MMKICSLISSFGIFILILLVHLQCTNDPTITVYPGPAGIDASDKYIVKVNDIESFTYKSKSQIDPIPGFPSWSGSDKEYPAGYFDDNERGWDGTSVTDHTASFTCFSFTPGKVRIEITKLTPGVIESCIIRPSRHNIIPEINGNTIAFTIDKPLKLSVEFNEDLKDKMFIFADAPEENIPDANGEEVLYITGGQNLSTDSIPEGIEVIYMAPGVHDIGKDFPLKSNQTLYLEGGSYVLGTLLITKAENVSIRGRGILCGGQFPHAVCHLITTRESYGLHIDGVTLLESPAYNVTVQSTPSDKDVMNTFKNLKIISWYFNTDGIHGGPMMTAQDIFVMCADDAFTLSGKSDQRIDNVVIWTLRGSALQFGWGSPGGGNTLVNDVDVIHYQSVAGETGDYIAAISCQMAGLAYVNNILVQNVTIEHMDSFQNKFLAMRTGPNPWVHYDTKASIANVIFRNIKVLCPTSGNTIFGYADHSRISNISFENLVVQGKVISDPAEANILIGDNASDIIFKAEVSAIDTNILPPKEYYADKDFSVRQGENQWYYQYWDGKYFIFLDWDGTHWKTEATQSKILSNGNIMPGDNASVKGWVSLYKGTINIKGNVKKHDLAGGDGVKVSILKTHNDVPVTIWPQDNDWKVLSYNDSKGFDHDITVDVELGDMIYFIVNKNSNFDHDETIWNPEISFQ